jgi:hypothetical protein
VRADRAELDREVREHLRPWFEKPVLNRDFVGTGRCEAEGPSRGCPRVGRKRLKRSGFCADHLHRSARISSRPLGEGKVCGPRNLRPSLAVKLVGFAGRGASRVLTSATPLGTEAAGCARAVAAYPLGHGRQVSHGPDRGRPAGMTQCDLTASARSHLNTWTCGLSESSCGKSWPRKRTDLSTDAIEVARLREVGYPFGSGREPAGPARPVMRLRSA